MQIKLINTFANKIINLNIPKFAKTWDSVKRLMSSGEFDYYIYSQRND